MKEFDIEGQRSYWGDKCSDKFRKRAKHRPQAGDRRSDGVPGQAAGRSLRAPGRTRPERSAFRAPCTSTTASPSGAPTSRSWDSKWWSSPRTDRNICRRGRRAGHRPALLPHQGRARARAGAGCARAWITFCVPNMVNYEIPQRRETASESHLCPWNQTLPFVHPRRAATGADARPHPRSHGALPPMGARTWKRSWREFAKRRWTFRVAPATARYRRLCGPGSVHRGPAGNRPHGARAPGKKRRAGAGAGGTLLQHVRPQRELRHPAQAARALRRQRAAHGFPARSTTRTSLDVNPEHVLELGAADSGGGAHHAALSRTCTWSTSPTSSAVRIPTSSRSWTTPAGKPVAGAPVRRPRQRRRLHHPLRSLSRQQRIPAMSALRHQHVSRKVGADHPLDGKVGLYAGHGRGQHPEAFAAVFRWLGVEAHPTPPSDARTRELGGKFTAGDECYPAKVTVGDFLRIMEQPGFDPRRTVFFMAAADGPCRFGQYAPYLKRLLAEVGQGEVQILSPSSQNGYADLGDIATPFMRAGWRALVCRRPAAQGAARNPSLRRRERRRRPGLTRKASRDLCQTIETSCADARLPTARRWWSSMRRARERFRRVPAHYDPETPLIGVVGEIFCRLNTFSNEDLVRKLEGYGAEAWLSDIAEWIGYTNQEVRRKLRLCGRGWSLEMVKAKLREHVQHSDEHALRAPFHEDFVRLRRAGDRATSGTGRALSAAHRRGRRDGAQRRQGRVPGAARRRRHHRHQPLHLHERHRERSRCIPS